MATRKYPPSPKAPGTAEKFTVWTVYQERWFGVRSFHTMDEARHFAREVLRGGVLITQDRVTHEFVASETI